MAAIGDDTGGEMADPRETRLRQGLEALQRLGVSAEDPTIETLSAALNADSTTALAVAERCGRVASIESARLLTRIDAEARLDKLLRREARRSLYRLKQRGVSAPAADAGTAAPARSPFAEAEAEGFLSFNDPLGDRLLWILKARGGGGLYHLSTVVNEPAGLKEAVLAEVNRKSVRGLREELEARHGLRLVEIDWRYCDWIAAEGYERARQRGSVSESAAHYPQLRLQLFSKAAAPAELPPRPETEPTSVDSSAALFEEAELRQWFLPEGLLAPYLARYREIRESPIVLDRPAQLSRVEEIVQAAVEQLFSAAQASSWRRRLDEAAYFFAKTARPGPAGFAAAVAAAIAGGRGGSGIPFCEELVRRSFGLFFAREAEREREEKASSVLVTPDDLRAEQARARQRPRGR
jgi:hypothetical protein